MHENDRQQRRQKVRDFIDANSKSPTTGAIYALIYGPLGLIYVSPKLAMGALFVATALGLVYWPLIGLPWLACVVAASYQVRTRDTRIRRSARYMVT